MKRKDMISPEKKFILSTFLKLTDNTYPYGTEEILVKKMKADGFTIPENIQKMLNGGNKTFYKVANGKDMYYDFASGSYKEIKFSSKMIFLKTLRADKKVVKSNDSASLIDLGDGVFNIEFHSKMNALNVFQFC